MIDIVLTELDNCLNVTRLGYLCTYLVYAVCQHHLPLSIVKLDYLLINQHHEESRIEVCCFVVMLCQGIN